MVNYNQLKPGMYLQRGDSIKSLSLLNPDRWFSDSTRNPSADTLAASVAWVFIALSHRRNELDGISTVTNWHRNDNELEDTVWFNFDIYDELPRIDEAWQLHGVAYYFKGENRGGRMTLEWLDPVSIEPDDQTIENRQYTQYWRTTNRGKRFPIPAERVLRLYRPGVRELSPTTNAGQATRLAAQVMRSMDATLDDFFDHNALPLAIVTVPQGTQEAERDRLQRFFNRTFNSLRGKANKSMAVNADISVTTLSLAPDQLELSSTRSDHADEILLAHDVPVSVRQSVNKAEAGTKSTEFSRTMVKRAKLIARKINADPDIQRSGLHLVVHEERMDYAQMERQRRSEAGQRLNDTVLDITAAFNQGAIERDNAMAMLTEIVQLDDEVADAVLPTQRGASFSLVAGGVLAEEQRQPVASIALENERKDYRKYLAKEAYKERPFNGNHMSIAEQDDMLKRHDPVWYYGRRVYP